MKIKLRTTIHVMLVSLGFFCCDCSSRSNQKVNEVTSDTTTKTMLVEKADDNKMATDSLNLPIKNAEDAISQFELSVRIMRRCMQPENQTALVTDNSIGKVLNEARECQRRAMVFHINHKNEFTASQKKRLDKSIKELGDLALGTNR